MYSKEKLIPHLEQCNKKLHCLDTNIDNKKEHGFIPNEKDYWFFHIDGKKLTNKHELLEIVAKEMHFPEYFGMNWDALDECLNDLYWLPAKGYITILNNFFHISSIKLPKETLKTFLSILTDASDEWKSRGKSFHVITIGDCKLMFDFIDSSESLICILKNDVSSTTE